MFAGRYLWWMMTSVAGFLFCVFLFDHLTWLAVQLSACQDFAGSCSGVTHFMEGLRSLGLSLSGGAVLVCTVVRLLYVRFNPLWIVAVFVWVLAATPFMLTIGDLAASSHILPRLVAVLPVAVPYLVTLSAFLCFRLEDLEPGMDTASRPLAWLAGLMALNGTLAAIAMQDNLAVIVQMAGIAGFSGLVHAVQGVALVLSTFGTGSVLPVWIAFAGFAVALLLLPFTCRIPTVRLPQRDDISFAQAARRLMPPVLAGLVPRSGGRTVRGIAVNRYLQK